MTLWPEHEYKGYRWGMAIDLTYSVAMGYLDRVSMERVLRLLEALGFSLWDDAIIERQPDGRYTLIHGLQEFREHLGGELHVTMLRGIGESFEVTDVDESVLTTAIASLERRGTTRLAGRVSRTAV
jgi:3-dehydroquinate synthase